MLTFGGMHSATSEICALVVPTRKRATSHGEPQMFGRHESLPISNNLGAGPVPVGTEALSQGNASEAAAKTMTRSRASEAA